MQIPSTSNTGTASSLSSASRPAVGQDAVETRSRVLPAVQQPVEIEAAINRQNPANRPTLVDEQVRLYGPFKGTNTNNQNTATGAGTIATDAAPADISIDEQAQGQQSQSGSGSKDDQSKTPGDSSNKDINARDSASTGAAATSRDAAGDKSQATSTEGADKRARASREARVQNVEQQQIGKLAARDRDVRAHEAAHTSIGGQYAGGASFTLEEGPDGVSYAVGGEVPIDISAVPDDPEATIRKMQTVQRAALAPADPSSADRSVAAQAAQIARQATVQLQSDQAAARADKVEAARQESTKAAEKRAEISDRLTAIQNHFDFSSTLKDAQRSRQIDIVTQGYSPLRQGMIGTLFDERV